MLSLKHHVRECTQGGHMAEARVTAGESKAAQIERAIRETAELDVVVEVRDGVITLEGVVDSERDREAAEDIAADLAGGLRIDNALEVQDTLPFSVDTFNDEQRNAAAAETPDEAEEALAELNPDLTDQMLVDDPRAASGPITSLDDDEDADEGAEAYVPPTDPVVTTDAHGQTEVLGGFEQTASDEVGLGEDGMGEADGGHAYGDEAIADAVRRELREDAATTDLQIRVAVRNGVVHLHGTVPGLEDADAAEEVASRVTGVREVVEGLDVEFEG
jgi:osmotically-inducible protein OsmY